MILSSKLVVIYNNNEFFYRKLCFSDAVILRNILVAMQYYSAVFDNYSEKSVVDFKYMKIKGYICLLNVQLRVIAKANKLITNL